MSKYTESRLKQKEDYFDPKSPNNVSLKQEDADIEDNNLIDDNYDKKKNNITSYMDLHDDYGSDVFFTTRSNSPLSQTKSACEERKVSFSSRYLPETNFDKKKSNASPLLLTTKKNRRQSAPATSMHTKEQIVDEMEKEQERVVLKLMKQIHELKAENQLLKKELSMHIGSRGNSFSKRNEVYSDRSTNSVLQTHGRTLSNASTVYNPRNNSVSSTSFRENVLTDFESLK
ncbi:uncharacterized protein HGUI_04063 [Hanseniaspora guilliermondii]|uniref:Uncharacterized protein n=1 Tax=Hanseniaspora guilliermondii TaxID=56406 RepID=A0A1L0FQL6_9ASCO|nr:uncharacterized protein HGUI_04063 [Hanseniaspora guilliermondii]